MKKIVKILWSVLEESYDAQFVKPKSLIQLTPVTLEIKFKIRNEHNINTNPAIAHVSVFLALSTCFGSPCEVKYFIPEKIIKKSATMPAKEISKYISPVSKLGIHEMVNIPPFAKQLPQSIIKIAYQRDI